MKTAIKFHAIDTLPGTDCPLHLSYDFTCFNDVRHAQIAGKYYKAILDDRNIVTFYYRDKNLANKVAHRYIIAMDWQRSDDRMMLCASSTAASRTVERILRQRLMYMVKIINTSNI